MLDPTRPLISCLVLLPALAGPSLANEGGRWIPRASMELARQETGAARIGNDVYVVGGITGSQPTTVTASVEVYDIARDRWRSAPPMPAPRDHLAAVAWDGKLYVMGGYSSPSPALDTFFVFDPTTNAWSSLAPLPQPRAGAWAVAQNDKIYLFGGRGASGAARRTTFIYDVPTNQWSSGAPLPTAREHLVAEQHDGLIYVIGGRSPAPHAVNERYEPATNQWTTMAPMPTARAAPGIASLRGKLYVAGGETPMLFDVNEVYDVATDTWQALAPMPIPRHGAAAVALDDGVLFPAGGILQGFGPSAAVDQFVPQRARRSPSKPSGPIEASALARIAATHALRLALGVRLR